MFKDIIIGRYVRIADSKDPSLRGRSGTVVDETKNTILLRENQGTVIMVPKSVVTLSIHPKDIRRSSFSIAGLELLATPEERIKG